METKQDIRVIKTKKSLYLGLLQLMKTKQFEEIKVSDICKIALVNRSTFYDHFVDKYELLSSLIKDLEKKLERKLDDIKNINYKDYYTKIIELLLDHLEENLLIYSSVIKNNNNSIAGDIFKDMILKNVDKHLKEKEQKIDIPTTVISTFYVSAVINVCLLYVKEPTKYKKEVIIKSIKKLLPNDIY